MPWTSGPSSAVSPDAERLACITKDNLDLEAPHDNLDLERWFRLPKGHERRIHGHSHAGVRMVQEGATLLLVLDAHEAHPEPFTAQELLPYRHAQEPTDQLQAIQRRKVMRKARSPKNDRSSSPS